MEVQAVDRARAAFLSGRTRPLKYRVRQLEALRRLITEREAEVTAALKHDLGKSQFNAHLFELVGLDSEIQLSLERLAEWTAPQPMEKTLLTLMDRVYVQPEPLGVVLIIGAWNYPFALTLQPLVGAIAAGNAAVIKPSELSGHSSRLLEELLPQYLDREMYPVVTGGVPETQELLRQRFDHIFYTGNQCMDQTRVEVLDPEPGTAGWYWYCRLGRCLSLSLCSRITWGKFANCGQTCIAPDYILCDPSIQDRVVEEIGRTVQEFYGNDPKKSPDYGRIVNKRHFKRVMSLLEGCTIALGGEHDESQCYIGPTVLKDVTPHSRVMQEEIFGPVLPILSAGSVDEAIRFINEREKPLALYVFSKNKKLIDRVIAETSSGGVTANDVLLHYTVGALPFGGVGHSGMGRYHGKHTFDQLSHHRACVVRSLAGEGLNQARYPPLSRRGLRTARFFMQKRVRTAGRGCCVLAVVSSLLALGLLLALLLVLLKVA
nr:PREDICTED: fatty aldehyde dehydrogenase-like [Lepisosteus oculatus]